jgi:CRP-like cAMP-binding protein
MRSEIARPDLSDRVPVPREIDERSAPRVGVRVEAEVHLTGFGWLRCAARDLGTGGVCIETASPIAQHAISRVVLQLTGLTPLSLAAEGRWQRISETGVLTGIRFHDADPRCLRQVRDFVGDRAMALSRLLLDVRELAGLTMDEGLDLAFTSRLREVPPSTWLCREGSRSPGSGSIYVVVAGRVAIDATLRFPHDLLVEEVGPGRLFGGLSLIAGVEQTEAAMAQTRCELLEFDRAAFRYLRTVKPTAAHRLTRAVIRRQTMLVRSLVQRISEFEPRAGGTVGPVLRERRTLPANGNA